MFTRFRNFALLILIKLVFLSSAYAIKIDSLRHKIYQFDEVEKQINEIVKLVDENIKDSAVGNMLIAELKIIGNQKKYEYAHKLVDLLEGKIYNEFNDYDRSLSHFKSFLDKSEDTTSIDFGVALREIGRIYHRQAEYDLALNHLFQSKKIFEKKLDFVELAKSIDILAGIYRKLENYEEAKRYLLESLNIRRKINDRDGIVVSYMMLGNLFANQSQYDDAIKMYSICDSILLENGDDKKSAMLSVNIGNLAYEKNNFEEALKYFEKSLNYFKKENNSYHLASILFNIANLYDHEGRFDSAIKYYKQAEREAIKADAIGILRDIYENIAIANFILKKTDTAWHYYEKFDEVTNQIFNDKLQNTIAEWEVKLETAEKEKEIVLLKNKEELNIANIKQRTTERNGLLLVTVLFLALVITLYIAFKSKQKANKELSAQKEEIQKNHEEKALLLKELHHRVKNNLQLVSSLLSLQSFQTTDDNTRDAITQGRNRVEAMSLIHQKLYQTDQITHIDLKEYVENLTLNTMYSFGFTEKDVEFSVTSESLMVEVDIAIPLGLIINELVTNSFKHAFKSVEYPKLDITLRKHKNKQLSINIKDNGAGLPNGLEFDKKGSFGMELIQSLSRQIRATIELHEGPGCHIELKTNAL